MSDSFFVEIDKHDLAELTKGLSKLQGQLPTHQVAALKRSGEFLANSMKRRAAKMHYDGVVEGSIGWKETHGVVAGKVIGDTSVVVIGPGARTGKMPIHAPLMEGGSTRGWWPNLTRLGAWAARRIPMISSREVFFIARAMAMKGMLSERNPRARGDRGYYYVSETFNLDGNEALIMLNESGFNFTAEVLNGIRT